MTGQYEEFQAWTGDNQDTEEEFQLNDIERPIPDGLPDPATYRMFLMPVGIKRKTKGGIILPDTSIDAQKWLNAIGRVAKLGPGCFRHQKYKDLGLTEKDFPKVGDLILYSAHAPLRFGFKGVRMIVINDDHWYARVTDEASTGYFKWYV
jgi:co-chaperonin GroES (HSP10)